MNIQNSLSLAYKADLIVIDRKPFSFDIRNYVVYKHLKFSPLAPL